ncbi:hypothetical protein [Brevibacillus sp. SYSU BS000544]|uniref:hypothetical protein n=1 Tax=Brevibacillus sp. SYSU BS000544 TaxID=3416443 RepID=UPI003CE51B06
MGTSLQSLSGRDRQYLSVIGDFQYVTGKMLPDFFQVGTRFTESKLKKLREVESIQKSMIWGTPIHPDSRLSVRRGVFSLTDEARKILGDSYEAVSPIMNMAVHIAVFEYVASISNELLMRVRGWNTAKGDFFSRREKKYLFVPDASFKRENINSYVLCDDERKGIEGFLDRIYPIIEYPFVREVCQESKLILICFTEDRRLQLKKSIQGDERFSTILREVEYLTYDEILRSIQRSVVK